MRTRYPVDVRPVCREDGCLARLQRLNIYMCGGMRSGGRHGCGQFFCDRHLHQPIHGRLDIHYCTECLGRIEQ